MNKRPFIILSAFLLLFSLIEKGQATETYRPETSVAGFIQLPGSGRQVYNFNPGWRFFRGDVRGAEVVNFDDRSWNVVSTPHTVELMPAEGSGCRNYQGPAWYRKHFVLPAETKGQRVVLHFEAAMGKQILYLNGKRIQEHLGGYLPFTLDLTANGVQAGDSCLLAVFTDNSDDKSYPPGKRQYTLDFAYHGGIYRDVCFYVGDTETAPIAVEQDPVANAISEDGTEEEEPEIDASLPTLLLVEDNKDLCQLIKLQLEDKFNIHIANNGVEGLKKVHLYHPDIVVTDQMMPEMDGLEMLQSIRKDFQISHIPVIILTAKNDEGAKTKAITLGANAYITKPFSKEYLLARIDQLLAERKLFRERIRQQMENQTTTEEDSYEQFLVKKDVQFLEKIHQVIEENMDDSDFNIDTIASGIGLSRSAFFKKLKSLTGLAPVDLVKEIRLNKSIELIKNTDLSVSEIAFAVGFKDSGYYSKCFRKKYNQSPREYMNEWRKGER